MNEVWGKFILKKRLTDPGISESLLNLQPFSMWPCIITLSALTHEMIYRNAPFCGGENFDHVCFCLARATVNNRQRKDGPISKMCQLQKTQDYSTTKQKRRIGNPLTHFSLSLMKEPSQKYHTKYIPLWQRPQGNTRIRFAHSKAWQRPRGIRPMIASSARN